MLEITLAGNWNKKLKEVVFLKTDFKNSLKYILGISGYNAGCGNVQTYSGMDIGTTGNDYSSDVVSRANFYRDNNL